MASVKITLPRRTLHCWKSYVCWRLFIAYTNRAKDATLCFELNCVLKKTGTWQFLWIIVPKLLSGSVFVAGGAVPTVNPNPGPSPSYASSCSPTASSSRPPTKSSANHSSIALPDRLPALPQHSSPTAGPTSPSSNYLMSVPSVSVGFLDCSWTATATST